MEQMGHPVVGFSFDKVLFPFFDLTYKNPELAPGVQCFEVN